MCLCVSSPLCFCRIESDSRKNINAPFRASVLTVGAADSITPPAFHRSVYPEIDWSPKMSRSACVWYMSRNFPATSSPYSYRGYLRSSTRPYSFTVSPSNSQARYPLMPSSARSRLKPSIWNPFSSAWPLRLLAMRVTSSSSSSSSPSPSSSEEEEAGAAGEKSSGMESGGGGDGSSCSFSSSSANSRSPSSRQTDLPAADPCFETQSPSTADPGPLPSSHRMQGLAALLARLRGCLVSITAQVVSNAAP
mmetsp:Transcript_34012/g.77640  ORF Transcript_34012/g.77640 Transcript_34012/m.77640 type:complete len:250 (-) Transcript_34012:530-1279(-)